MKYFKITTTIGILLGSYNEIDVRQIISNWGDRYGELISIVEITEEEADTYNINVFLHDDRWEESFKIYANRFKNRAIIEKI